MTPLLLGKEYNIYFTGEMAVCHTFLWGIFKQAKKENG